MGWLSSFRGCSLTRRAQRTQRIRIMRSQTFAYSEADSFENQNRCVRRARRVRQFLRFTRTLKR